MKDILWTIYLIIMLLDTVIIITYEISRLIKKASRNTLDIVLIVITTILWAIWYMYFLH